MIPPKILEQIEAAAKKYAGNDVGSKVDKFHFADGANFGFQLAQEIYGPVVEALELAILRIPSYHAENCGYMDYHCNCGVTKLNNNLREVLAAYREVMETGGE